jgi:uncharacterized membrane protein|tara:strand:- start:186 stop:503 length:318 start_codon:yes stop_codon:yes gene_type:complete
MAGLIELFKKLLGISDLEARISELSQKVDNLEKVVKSKRVAKKETWVEEKKEVLKALTGRMTTNQLAKKLGQSRSWTSTVLNKLQREGKVVEAEKRGKKVLYSKK